MTPDERWTAYASMIARRMGFNTPPVERFLRTLADDPYDAYLRVARLDDSTEAAPEFLGPAWDFVWKGVCTLEGPPA